MKNIIITGGAGYIGSHMVHYLLQKNINVFVIDNFCNSDHTRLENIQRDLNKSIHIINHDITQDLSDIHLKTKIDGIIHFAAYKSVPESMAKPLEYYHNNVVGTLNLARWAISNNIDNLVFSSTAAVYGDVLEQPITEQTPTNPLSVYGRTKLFSENILKDIVDAEKGFNVVSLRYFNVVGNLGSGLIGDNVDSPAILPSIIRSYLNKKDKLQIYGNDYDTKDGTPVRDYVHVEDLVDAHFKSLMFLEREKGFKMFNIGTSTGYTLLELIQTFERIVGEKLNYEIKDRKTGDIAVSVADSTLAKDILEWRPQKTLEETFISMLKYYESQ